MDIFALENWLWDAACSIRGPYRKMMIIRSVEEPYIEVSRQGIFVKGKKIEVVEK